MWLQISPDIFVWFSWLASTSTCIMECLHGISALDSSPKHIYFHQLTWTSAKSCFYFKRNTCRICKKRKLTFLKGKFMLIGTLCSLIGTLFFLTGFCLVFFFWVYMAATVSKPSVKASSPVFKKIFNPNPPFIYYRCFYIFCKPYLPSNLNCCLINVRLKINLSKFTILLILSATSCS